MSPATDAGPIRFLGRFVDRPRAWGLLSVLVLARAAVYAAQGVGFVLDDWSLAGYRHFNGQMTDFMLESRPGTWLVLTGIYAIADTRPLVLFLVITALYVVAVLVLHALASRFWSPTTALVIAAMWVILPNHNTIALWGATGNVLAGLLLLLVGALALTHGRWLAAGALFGASVLSYELFTPLCLLAPLLIPTRWQRRPPSRPVSPAQRLAVAAMSLAAAAWSATHSQYPLELRLPDPVVFWSGHFGSGLLAGADAPAVLRALLAGAAAIGVIWYLAVRLRGGESVGERRPDGGPDLVLVGIALMALGGWVAFTLPIGAFGQNDRLFAASSIGSALIITGFLRLAWQRSGAGLPSDRTPRALVVVATVAFVGVCLVGQHVSMGSWIRAGDDAVAALRHIEANADDPADSHFVIGPEPLYRNAVAGLQDGDGKWALRLTFGEGSGTLRLPPSPDDFVPRTPEETLVTWSEVLARPNP